MNRLLLGILCLVATIVLTVAPSRAFVLSEEAGAPVGAHYLVDLANGTLTAEVVVTAAGKAVVTAADNAAIKTLLGYYTATGDLDSDLQYLAGFTPADDVKAVLTAANNAAIKALLAYYTATGDLDSDLQYLAGFTPTADVKAILTAADNAAIKALLSYYSATADLDAELQALAGLTSAANKLPYFTGSGTAGVCDLSAYMRGLLDDANEATFKASINLEAGTDFYSMSAADTAFEAELNNSAGLLAALSDETGTGAAVFSNNPRFVGDFGIGSAILLETDIEILDEAATEGLTHTELMYLKDFTGVSGSGSIAGSVSPQFTTPDLGVATATSITLDASATPGWIFRDSGNPGTDKEIAELYANYISGADGAEDGEVHLQVMDSGSEKTIVQGEGVSGVEFVDLGPPDCTYDVRTYLSVSTVDGQYSGVIAIRTVDAGATSVFGQALHVDTDGELIVADADVASAGAAPCICLAIEAGTGSKKVLLHGIITETDWNWTIGGLVYLSDDPTTTEGLTQTAPATQGDQVQVVGVALSADTMLFNPSLVLVEVPVP